LAKGLDAQSRDLATDRLLSRPEITPDLDPYYEAFLHLQRDRPFFSHSLGMAGGILMQQKSRRSAIRAEGKRLAFSGDDLDDFVEIVAHCEDVAFRETFARQAQAVRTAVQNNSGNGGATS